MNLARMPYRIAVLGGGISGLAAAYFLKKKWGSQIELSLFEAKDKLGGWIQTVTQDNYLFELGPHSLRVTEEDGILSLLQELNLQDQVLYADQVANSRFLYLDGRLQKLPSGFLSLLRHPLARIIFPALLKEPFVSCEEQEETVASFFSRRFSAKIVDSLVDPLTKGIYGGDPHMLSMASCFPEILQIEKNYGSLLKGMFQKKKSSAPKIITLKRGLGSLVKALAEKLTGAIHLNATIESMTFSKDEAILKIGAREQHFDKVVSALPAFQLAKLLPHVQAFSKIAFAPFVLVSLGFKSLKLPFQGFGYLIPGKEKQNILGAVFDSAIFPQQNYLPESSRITVMVGGWQQRELTHLPDEKIYELAMKDISRHFKTPLYPDTVLMTRLSHAVPQYFIGHEALLKNIEKDLSELPIHLLGNSFKGVSVVHCIKQARDLVLN